MTTGKKTKADKMTAGKMTKADKITAGKITKADKMTRANMCNKRLKYLHSSSVSSRK